MVFGLGERDPSLGFGGIRELFSRLGRYLVTPNKPAPVNSQLGQNLANALRPAIQTVRNQALGPTPIERLRDQYEAQRRALLSQANAPFRFPLQSDAQLRALATQQANLQYNPQIAQINQLISQAKNVTARQQGVATDVYNALASSYKSDVKAARAEAKRTREEEQMQLEQISQGLRDTYNESTSSLKDTLQQLGIQASGADVFGELAKSQQAAQEAAALEDAAVQQGISQTQAGDISYFERGAPIARQTGAEAVTQLGQSLQDYVTQQNAQRAQLETSRQLDISAALSQLQKEQQSQYNQALNQYQSRQGDIYSQLQALQSQEQKALTPAKIGSGLSGASQFLADAFTNDPYYRQYGPAEANRYVGFLLDLIKQTGAGPAGSLKIGPEQFVNRAAQYARQHGVSENLLTKAALAYLGRG